MEKYGKFTVELRSRADRPDPVRLERSGTQSPVFRWVEVGLTVGPNDWSKLCAAPSTALRPLTRRLSII